MSPLSHIITIFANQTVMSVDLRGNIFLRLLFLAAPRYNISTEPNCNMTVENTMVSVIIPVRNGKRFVHRTLVSALAQTYDPIEVVFVDDGSTDRTATLVEGEAVGGNRIRLFRTQKSGFGGAKLGDQRSTWRVDRTVGCR
jgi:cellulose synthase/poly-beta-1,6-N-acetylglucosamine synthase-like glycosyltransferase